MWHLKLVEKNIIPDWLNQEATKWWVCWRLFFMPCAKLLGFKNGEEWIVSHYLFDKIKAAANNGSTNDHQELLQEVSV